MEVQNEAPKHPAVNKKHNWVGLVLGCILLLGLILRISYLLEIVNSPGFSFPQIDAGYHDYWPPMFTHQNSVERGDKAQPVVFYPSWMPMIEWKIPSWNNDSSNWHSSPHIEDYSPNNS